MDQITYEQVAALHAPAPDHVIRYGTAPQQFGHLRLPKGPGPFPVVIFIHGGCYRNSFTIDHAGPFEQAVADAGYAVWSLEYRRVGDEGGAWPGTFQDVAHGADHLRQLASRYSLDLNRVVAAGHSAGGNLALWLGGRKKIPSASPLWTADPLALTGIVALAPAGDLAELHAKNGCGGMVDPLMGGSPSAVPDRYRAGSHGELLPTGVPQTIVIGGQDAGFRDFGRSYVAKAKSAGEPRLKVIEIPSASHFDVIAPVTSAWPIVRQALNEIIPPAR